ncbi:hypothetical protein [Fulvivirga ligni]|uniref:hypothetical protein n=1 Tax=Fulvivirga ligni TaxID=2904246 RepID=UPI001F374BEC|nr:hypothetical protein [Fulvivirga ligni]UII19215.1 hypothetical protein LVD16_15320 [Fulvivirga ligni]
MKKSIILLLAMSFILSSCVYSLFPIYTPDTIRYNQRLIGTWKGPENELTFKLNNKEDTSEGYIMTIIDSGGEYKFKTFLVEIGNEFYLDMFPEMGDLHHALEVYAMNLYPMHTFQKVSIKDNQLSITTFSLERLSELFKRNQIRLRHELVSQNGDPEDAEVVITAQPKELQKFIEVYSKDESVFDQTVKYTRE